MGIRVAWAPETRDLFSAALGDHQARRFLVVERLPDGGWDWLAWSEDRAGASQHGLAETAAMAMAAAEQAASLLAPGPDIFRGRVSEGLQSPVPALN